MTDVATAARTACVWEATARKAGNVHPLARFADLMYDDFVRSAGAIAPVLQRMVDRRLGLTVLEAIRATRDVVSTNTNLGIVLLLAPLSKCRPDDIQEQVRSILGATTVEDAKHVYEAIRLAVPGGLGKVEDQDVTAEPTLTLREVMALAADRDLVARQYATAFDEVLHEGVPALIEGWERFGRVEAAILACQLRWLTRFADSLVVRKLGRAAADEVKYRAAGIDLAMPEGRRRYDEFDAWLRADGHARNPGTTADLVTACLFVALRGGRMTTDMPFTWEEYRTSG